MPRTSPPTRAQTTTPSGAHSAPSAATPEGQGQVLGWDLPGPRLTLRGWVWALGLVAGPLLALGLLLDALLQWVWGWCLGVWCWF